VIQRQLITEMGSFARKARIQAMLLNVIGEFGSPTDKAVPDVKPAKDAKVRRLEHPNSVFDVRNRMELRNVVERFARTEYLDQSVQLLRAIDLRFPPRLKGWKNIPYPITETG
jgi:hypothetical protein